MFLSFRMSVVRSDVEAWKPIDCASCRVRFYVHVSATAAVDATSLYGIGHNDAEVAADRAATRIASRRLAKAIEPVPCPACGWCQPEMLRAFRKRYLRWATALGWAITLSSLLTYPVLLYVLQPAGARGPAPPEHLNLALGATGLQAVFGLSFLAGLWLVRRRYDPNVAMSHDDRLDRGRRLALTPEQYQELVATKPRPYYSGRR